MIASLEYRTPIAAARERCKQSGSITTEARRSLLRALEGDIFLIFSVRSPRDNYRLEKAPEFQFLKTGVFSYLLDSSIIGECLVCYTDNNYVKNKITLGGSEALLGAAFLFAITNVLVREMADMWGDQAQVAVRFALVWLILIAVVRFKKSAKTTIPRSKRIAAIAYSIVAAASILFFTLSVQATTIANTLFTSNATELFVAFVLGSFLLSEKVTARKLIAIGLALAGLVLYSGSILVGSTGIIFGLLAGATVALCNLFAKKLKGVDLGAIMRLQFGLGAVFMIVLTLIFSPDDIVRTVSVEGVIATILFALILIAATRLVLYGFQHSDINIASVILSSQLALGALLGFFIYQEVLAPHEIVSGLLILCAAIIGGMAQKPTEKDVQVHP